MASAWVKRTRLPSGALRYRVHFRLGGRESTDRYGGSFKTKREALIRRDYVAGELAALRVPNIRLLDEKPAAIVTVRQIVRDWRGGRRDVAAGTLQTYDVALGRIVPRLGSTAIDELDAHAVNRFVGELVEAKLKRETIRKTLGVLAQALDWHGLNPNPARDRRIVRLPRREYDVPRPPIAEHVEAVFRLLPSAYRLPLLAIDATGMRVSEVEALTWGDVDEARRRWRVLPGAEKMRHAKWITVPEAIFAAVVEQCPRDDRVLAEPLFEGFGADRFRTAITRACRAAGVPHFSPHDLRDRRISLLHAQGVSWARIAEMVGHESKMTTANTYTHVLIDEREVDVPKLLLARLAHAERRPVRRRVLEIAD